MKVGDIVKVKWEGDEGLWKVAEIETTEPGIGIVQFLISCEAVKSKKEARRLIKQGGCYINNERVGMDKRITENDLASESIIVVRTGKKNYRLVKFE